MRMSSEILSFPSSIQFIWILGPGNQLTLLSYKSLHASLQYFTDFVWDGLLVLALEAGEISACGLTFRLQIYALVFQSQVVNDTKKNLLPQFPELIPTHGLCEENVRLKSYGFTEGSSCLHMCDQ